MFKKAQIRKDIDLLVEEKLYAHVAMELKAGDIRQGLWTKATAKADTSSEADVRRKYIELRVEFLRAEGRLQKQFVDEVLAATDELEDFEEEEETEEGSFRHTLIGLIIVILIVFMIYGMVASSG